MNKKLEDALEKVEVNYGDLIEIANAMLEPILAPINTLVATVNSRIQNLPIDLIRDFILELQLKAYELSEIKEKSAMKAELATALQKEAFAVSFSGLEGAAAVKDKLALVETSAETVSSVLYTLVSNLLKTKLDQLHRLVDALKSILMSRMQETKFMNLGATNEISAPTNGRITLNE